jgi:hypothetical protein
MLILLDFFHMLKYHQQTVCRSPSSTGSLRAVKRLQCCLVESTPRRSSSGGKSSALLANFADRRPNKVSIYGVSEYDR